MATQDMSLYNTLEITEYLLDSFPTDNKSEKAKKEIETLRRRINVSAPEMRNTHFWQSTSGYYYICREFNGSDDRSLAMMKLYSSVLENRT